MALVAPLIFFVAGFLAALITRRVAAVAVATLFWPTFYAGLVLGAWGAGVGESWQVIALSLSAACCSGSVAGLLVGRVLLGRPAGARRRSRASGR